VLVFTEAVRSKTSHFNSVVFLAVKGDKNIKSAWLKAGIGFSLLTIQLAALITILRCYKIICMQM
jgi:hypothetical protein